MSEASGEAAVVAVPAALIGVHVRFDLRLHSDSNVAQNQPCDPMHDPRQSLHIPPQM